MPDQPVSKLEEVILAKRTYEVIFIVDPAVADDEVMKLSEGVQKIITNQGGTITKTEMMGKRQLAYEINHKRDGTYVLLEGDHFVLLKQADQVQGAIADWVLQHEAHPAN